MIKFHASVTTAALAVLLAACAAAPTPKPLPEAQAVESADVPEPFWDFDPTSTLSIDYSDVDTVLATMVEDVGRSDRARLPPMRASTGTRLQAKVRRQTSTEGNRFHFEEFEDNEEYKKVLAVVRKNLEKIPDQIPLKSFNREEQLAYWLNLYNIAILEKLVALYPERNLEKELTGKNSILDERFLNVSGVPLSLNDIQHTILRWNYDGSPLVLYGLYQGIIGGPNIRKLAYSGPDVYRQLQDNAEEFINSNRGTYWKGGDVFHVSSYYARNRSFFPDFDTDLKGHLLNYIEDPQRQQLQQSERLYADIDDWSITDTSGGSTQVGGSLSQNQAAMLGAVTSSQHGRSATAGGTVEGSTSTNFTTAPVGAVGETREFNRFSRIGKSKLLTIESVEEEDDGEEPETSKSVEVTREDGDGTP